MIRISLSDADFTRLVAGGVVKKRGVEIALTDIGFERMKYLIAHAEAAPMAVLPGSDPSCPCGGKPIPEHGNLGRFRCQSCGRSFQQQEPGS